MLGARRRVLLAVIAVSMIGLAAVASPAGADGVLTPSATSVPVGGSFEVTASGCDHSEDSPTHFTFQQPEISFVTGVGAVERAVALNVSSGAVTVPAWVDPDETAVLRGRCTEYRYDFEAGTNETVELFTYPEVEIDITPGTAPRETTLTLDRTTAAGGQVVTAEITGCLPGEDAGVSVLADTDLGLGGIPRHVTGADQYGVDGTVTMEVALINSGFGGGGPLAEGDYVVVAACYSYTDTGFQTWMAEPTMLHVRGTTEMGSMSITYPSRSNPMSISGDVCVGRPVTVRLTGNTVGLDEVEISETMTVTPAADGTWTASWSPTSVGFVVRVSADCGDPTDDGYRYRSQSWWEDGYSSQWVGRISPTSSPVDGPIDVHVEGECASHSMVQLRSEAGEVLSEGHVTEGAMGMGGRATVTAPPIAGSYELVALCDGLPSYPSMVEVFEPTPVAPHRPLPSDPAVGWPDNGDREHFQGRIGPIDLPAGNHHGMHGALADGSTAELSPTALGPSGLGIAVPRPAGDFAITRMSFDLVDADGNPVSTSDAHLHHMVVANLSSSNPACPGGTFGLPGEIIAAAGAERTAIDFGSGPYGLVVEEEDAWAGVYELMSMSDQDQTVYLTYDMEIRRDVENVRPVTTYFGSATGCGSFTWTIDGSGTPDTQGHYLTVAEDGVLVGAGGHIHNGGVHTELYDDRGRLLCRNELVLGEAHDPDPDDHDPDDPGTTTTTMHDHGTTTTTMHDHGSTTTTMHDHSPSTTVTATTIGVPIPAMPPEMYPDDPPLEAITTCQTHEQLQAGERLYFEATYSNDRARSGVMGIYMLYVWEGGGPARPNLPGPRPPVEPTAPSPSSPTTSTIDGRPQGSPDPTDPADPDTPTSAGEPGTGAGPDGTGTDGDGAGPGSVPDTAAPGDGGRSGEVAGEATARPARPARPYRGNASYTG